MSITNQERGASRRRSREPPEGLVRGRRLGWRSSSVELLHRAACPSFARRLGRMDRQSDSTRALEAGLRCHRAPLHRPWVPASLLPAAHDLRARLRLRPAAIGAFHQDSSLVRHRPRARSDHDRLVGAAFLLSKEARHEILLRFRRHSRPVGDDAARGDPDCARRRPDGFRASRAPDRDVRRREHDLRDLSDYRPSGDGGRRGRALRRDRFRSENHPPSCSTPRLRVPRRSAPPRPMPAIRQRREADAP